MRDACNGSCVMRDGSCVTRDGSCVMRDGSCVMRVMGESFKVLDGRKEGGSEGGKSVGVA